MRLRGALYDAGVFAAARVPARVVSVGNLTVGGTGKTPAALWLAGALQRRGRRVAIVARGYRKRRPGVVVVGVDGRPLVSPEEGGDEAVMLARRFAGPVLTGERRVEAARAACARFAVDTIVLDDGFQHRALARDADLVLLVGRRGGAAVAAGRVAAGARDGAEAGRRALERGRRAAGLACASARPARVPRAAAARGSGAAGGRRLGARAGRNRSPGVRWWR